MKYLVRRYIDNKCIIINADIKNFIKYFIDCFNLENDETLLVSIETDFEFINLKDVVEI